MFAKIDEKIYKLPISFFLEYSQHKLKHDRSIDIGACTEPLNNI